VKKSFLKFEKFESINRIRNKRLNIKPNFRLDMAERLNNFDDVFFQNFIKTLDQEDFITYPCYEDYDNLKKNIAKLHKVNKENIYIDSGSDACIKSIFHLFSKNNHNYVCSEPSFPMYRIYAEIYKLKCKTVKYNNDKTLPEHKILNSTNSKTILTILPNPNSPFGDFKSNNKIEKIAKQLDKKNIFFMIDEAYNEFSPESSIKLIKKYKNTIILKTFSKAWGAAGCRVGYLIANKEIISNLEKIQLTYPITRVSVKFINYLIENKKIINDNIKTTIKHRDKLCLLLKKNGFDVLKSNTNTIHFHHQKSQNEFVHKILDKYKVAYKKGTNIGTPISVIGDKRNTWVRISIGPNIHKQKYFKEILSYKIPS